MGRKYTYIHPYVGLDYVASGTNYYGIVIRGGAVAGAGLLKNEMVLINSSKASNHVPVPFESLHTYSVVCVCFVISILGVRLVGRTSRGHTGFLIHLRSAVIALIFLLRRIQPFLSLVNREVEFCVLTI